MRMTLRLWLRLGLVALAVPDTAVGGWALVAPASFYRDFPAPRHHWVSALPPYNEHLLTDFGGALLALAVLLWIAAASLERRLVLAVLAASLVQAAAHLAYHLATPARLPAGDDVLSDLALGFSVFVSAALLLVAWRRWERGSNALVLKEATL
jgi:hypothetical protein